ncbi:autophagy protein 16 [Plenodomus tracheiphilus IPT5]|uniref:Autophagy protein 16 n=1 Tax=Plenodomus tracheiphilus IPT5 TaxID=1408161 RepID=A0A6A7B7R5_9PLEO|nr:autophagy protein 16 [Plenodomus tracheiphilus IPT5]
MSNPLAEYLSALEARDAREHAHAEYVNAYTKLADRTAAPASVQGADAQLRSELASTQRTRGDLEAKVNALSTELSTFKVSHAQQKQHIEQLEKVRSTLERRGKDRADELKGKGRFVEEVQDEMVALNLQLNVAEQEKERLKKENDELTRRWMEKMDDEARKMNDRMGWEEPKPGKRGSK